MNSSVSDQPETAARAIVVVERDPAIAGLYADRLAREGWKDMRVHAPGDREALNASLRSAAVIVCGDADAPDDQVRLVHSLHTVAEGKPLVALAPATGRSRVGALLDAGAAAVLVKCPGYLDQLGPTVAAAARQRDGHILRQSLDEIRQENRTLQSLIERLEAVAMVDPLTGVSNRRALDSHLGTLFASAGRYGSELACLMFDLDHLKAVNDRLGHAAGDELLRAAAAAMTTECRKSDIVARVGGDEFLVLLPHTPSSAAMHLAQRIQRTFKLNARPVASRLGPMGRKLGLSVGVSCTGMPGIRTQADLLNRADDTMYAAKRAAHERANAAADEQLRRMAG